eukprot:scaffold129918_cov37-Tisochrysis_lutea.AAC.2
MEVYRVVKEAEEAKGTNATQWRRGRGVKRTLRPGNAAIREDCRLVIECTPQDARGGIPRRTVSQVSEQDARHA